MVAVAYPELGLDTPFFALQKTKEKVGVEKWGSLGAHRALSRKLWELPIFAKKFFFGKKVPQVLPAHIQSFLKVFCIKTKLCIIFTKAGRVRKLDADFHLIRSCLDGEKLFLRKFRISRFGQFLMYQRSFHGILQQLLSFLSRHISSCPFKKYLVFYANQLTSTIYIGLKTGRKM